MAALRDDPATGATTVREAARLGHWPELVIFGAARQKPRAWSMERAQGEGTSSSGQSPADDVAKVTLSQCVQGVHEARRETGRISRLVHAAPIETMAEIRTSLLERRHFARE